jgi:hypothetical protein
MTPSEAKPIKVQKSVFDLDSKEDVTLQKVGNCPPVATMHELNERLAHDSATILWVMNKGLEAHFRETLEADETVPWQLLDGEGNLVPFSGTTLSEEKSAQLAANVLSMAKMLFGYSKDMVGGKDAKRKAKDDAQAMLLSNPAVIEALKK